MIKKKVNPPIPQETIINQIYIVRGYKVMLDMQLAVLYKVETRALKQAVRRNKDLFPSDFMFTLTASEVAGLVSQNVIPSKQYLGGARPFAFTETGVAMLSSVLKSKRAKAMNIAIMRAFVELRRTLIGNTELRLIIEEIRRNADINARNTEANTKNIDLLFHYLDELIDKKKNEKPRIQIGYKTANVKSDEPAMNTRGIKSKLKKSA